ncbi:hypothetical protein [Runella sp.]|uniref:hypothetical protein n=1 Tax=Runella sp. TaxID=1960881 RepID=UPI003D0A77F0
MKHFEIKELTVLTQEEQLMIQGGGEPGFFVGYYAEKAWEAIKDGWSALQKWRESNQEKYGPWIG